MTGGKERKVRNLCVFVCVPMGKAKLRGAKVQGMSDCSGKRRRNTFQSGEFILVFSLAILIMRKLGCMGLHIS